MSLLRGSFFVLVALSDIVKLSFPRTLIICLHRFFSFFFFFCPTPGQVLFPITTIVIGMTEIFDTASCEVILTKF